MSRFERWLAVLAAGLLVAFALPSSAAASYPDPYITITNGTIVTNQGQQPQVNVQFGNRGTAPASQVVVACTYPGGDAVGSTVQVAAGPFRRTLVEHEEASHVVGFFEGYGLFTAEGIHLPPGQNHTVSFTIAVTAPVGTSATVECQLSGYPVRAVASAELKVQ
jgi:hypothetical protein